MHMIHLLCAFEHLLALLRSLEEQVQALDGVVVQDWGCTCKQERGYIVLQCDGEADEAFLEQLSQEMRVLDYSVYCPEPLPGEEDIRAP